MTRAWRFLFVLLCWGAATADDNTPARLADLLGSEADTSFARAVAPRTFTFPADHGPHPEFRNEWWYVTGNLDDGDGRRFGFELTFFRFALTPTLPASSSAWRTNQVYIAHLAVTDANGEQILRRRALLARRRRACGRGSPSRFASGSTTGRSQSKRLRATGACRRAMTGSASTSN